MSYGASFMTISGALWFYLSSRDAAQGGILPSPMSASARLAGTFILLGGAIFAIARLSADVLPVFCPRQTVNGASFEFTLEVGTDEKDGCNQNLHRWTGAES